MRSAGPDYKGPMHAFFGCEFPKHSARVRYRQWTTPGVCCMGAPSSRSCASRPHRLLCRTIGLIHEKLHRMRCKSRRSHTLCRKARIAPVKPRTKGRALPKQQGQSSFVAAAAYFGSQLFHHRSCSTALGTRPVRTQRFLTPFVSSS